MDPHDAPSGPLLLAFSAFRFPHGDAMSNRLLQLVRAAMPIGGTAVVVNDWPMDGSRPPDDVELPPDVWLITLTGGAGGRLRRWLWQRTRPVRALRALRRAGIRTKDVAAVCLHVGLWNLSTWAVLRAAVRRPVTVDVLERHDPQQFPRGRLAPYFVRHRWSSWLAGRLANRVIVVSETLGQRFRSAGRPTLVVPPQIDRADYRSPAPPSLADGLRLLYAGSAGPKDLLAVVLGALDSLPDADRTRVRLVIAGMTREQAVRDSDLSRELLDAVADRVTFLGRVSRARVLAELGAAHFSVLVRPDAGYARAGFPSKVPESLAAGCPVLLNCTSDLARYVIDGHQGIVLSGPTVSDVRQGLLRALELDDDAWWRMSHAARAAANAFDYRSWRPALSGFVTGSPATPGGQRSASAASSAGASH